MTARARQRLTAAAFRRIALSFDGAIEASHMNHPDFRANGKIFATIHPDDRRGMVKLLPEEQAQFVRDHPDMFAPENGAWGRQGCTRVDFAAADEETLGEAMTLAWQHVVQSPAKSRTRKAPARKRR